MWGHPHAKPGNHQTIPVSETEPMSKSIHLAHGKNIRENARMIPFAPLVTVANAH